MHVLALIAEGFARNMKELQAFLKQTFFFFQYGDLTYLEDKIESILDELISWKFVGKKGSSFFPTRLGKRVSELYLDPLTAHRFVKGLENARKINEISFLQLICNSTEMRPLLNVSLAETKEIVDYLIKNEEYFLENVPSEWEIEYDEFLKSVKTAMCLEAWINEATEDEILTKFRVAPGELRTKLEIADWLL